MQRMTGSMSRVKAGGEGGESSDEHKLDAVSCARTDSMFPTYKNIVDLTVNTLTCTHQLKQNFKTFSHQMETSNAKVPSFIKV